MSCSQAHISKSFKFKSPFAAPSIKVFVCIERFGLAGESEKGECAAGECSECNAGQMPTEESAEVGFGPLLASERSGDVLRNQIETVPKLNPSKSDNPEASVTQRNLTHRNTFMEW